MTAGLEAFGAQDLLKFLEREHGARRIRNDGAHVVLAIGSHEVHVPLRREVTTRVAQSVARATGLSLVELRAVFGKQSRKRGRSKKPTPDWLRGTAIPQDIDRAATRLLDALEEATELLQARKSADLKHHDPAHYRQRFEWWLAAEQRFLAFSRDFLPAEVATICDVAPPDDSGYKPRHEDPLLRGAGRAVGSTADSLRRGHAFTAWELNGESETSR
jgi:hypothetical protein